jgi:subtilisin family serine protease
LNAVRLFVIASLFAVLGVASPVTAADAPAGRWIVQLKPGAPASEVIAQAPATAGGRDLAPTQRFNRVLNGFAAPLTFAQRSALLADLRVIAVVPDVAVQATGEPYPKTANEVQPGIRRVGADDNPHREIVSPEVELDVDIAVLDTGIQPDNQELNIAGGYNCTDEDQPESERDDPDSWKDSPSFGHGTHVAGIAAARENGRGVAGVAQGARLWAIKVLDGNGNGYWSWVICGLDHVAGMREPGNPSVPVVEVINMSLASTGADDGSCGHDIADLLHQAVCRVAAEGITMVAAAGNAASNAANYVPGAYDELITVSAMADWNGQAAGGGSPPEDCTRTDADDAFASFSNYGPDVDLIAPGVCVLSTLPIDTLELMSGTSMATPHVVGAAALYFLAEAAGGRTRPTPEQVRAALVDRGTLDWKVNTDRDSEHEPALDASDLSVAPDFTIGTSRGILRVPPGGSGNLDVWIARLHGFDSAVDLEVTGATVPAGTSATFSGDPSSPPAEEAMLTIDVGSATATGSYEIEITGEAGSANRSAAFTLVVYATDGASNGPYLKLLKDVESGAISVPVRAKWASVSKAQRYELQRSVDGSPWTTLAKTYSPKFDLTAWPGTRLQLRVRAKVGGTWRAWQTGRSSVIVPYEPAESPVVLQGDWQFSPLARPYSDDPQYSIDSGATASLQFTGRSVAWVTTRGSTRGRARVSIDGTVVATIDLYASLTKHRQMVFAHSWTTQGVHTVSIEVLGQPSGRPRVDLDALVVVLE